MNGHEDNGNCEFVDTGEYLYMYIAFSNFLFCWFFPLYMYINKDRNIGCILYIRPFWAELKAVKSVWVCGF